jgi:nucleoside phosphorylase
MPRADIAILTVIPEEYEAVLASLSSYGCKIEHDPGSSTVPNQFGWGTGELQGAGDHVYRIVVGIVVQPGPGRMASAVSATCARYRPQYVLIVGIAGGFPQDGLTKGDVAISRSSTTTTTGRSRPTSNPGWTSPIKQIRHS